MSRVKTYKRDQKAKHSLPKEFFMAQMTEEGLDKLTLYECAPLVNSKNIKCWRYKSVFPKTECGKKCEGYSPCNGVSGKCTHRAYVYTPFRKVILTAYGRIVIIGK